MYNHFGETRVPAEFVDRLEALEQEIQGPIRLIPQGRQVRENSWSAEHRGEFTVAQAHATGITIAIGARGEGGGYPYLYTDPADSAWYFEVPTPSVPWDTLLEYDFGANGHGEERGYNTTTRFGEVDEDHRIIAVWPTITSYYNDRYTNPLWEVVVDTAENLGSVSQLTDEEREQRRQERALLAFNRYVERVFSGQLTARRQSIDSRTTAISLAQTTIARETAALIQDQQLLDAMLLVQQNDAGATMRQEYELLGSHPRLASRNLLGSALVLTTTDDLRLTREDTNESRWLGAFEITINLQSFKINIRNLNTMRGGRHHPHIPGDGSPCFGSHANSFYELLGQGQLYVCFDLLLQYLESVNLRDEWGRYASYWFEVADERPEGWQPVEQEPVDEIETEQDATGVLVTA